MTTKTLTISPNWVGDTVMAIPLLNALGATDRRLSVLAKPHLVPLLSLIPAINSVVPRSESTADTARAINEGGYDEAVVLPNSFRSALIPFRARIPRRWGYKSCSAEGLLRGLLLSPGVPQPKLKNRHQAEDYAELLNAMEVPSPTDWVPRIAIPMDRKNEGRALLNRANLKTDRSPLVGLFAGAEFGPSKRWPWKRFVEVSRKVRAAKPGGTQIILAGPKEIWTAVRIHEETAKIHPVVGPDLDLAQLASVISELDLLITNDSGPMHMAAALGVPCLALFGPTDPTRTRPYGPEHEVVYTDRWCSPCFRRRCPLIHHRCMRDITPDNVAATAVRMLADK